MSYPPKGEDDYLALGDYNAVCWVCGTKKKASKLKKHWQGYWVCPEHWEARQPQDFVSGVPDIVAPPWVQPMPEASYVNFCTPEGMSAIAGYAISGCAVAGYISPMFDYWDTLPPTFTEDACTILGHSAIADEAVADCAVGI